MVMSQRESSRRTAFARAATGGREREKRKKRIKSI
jgi:hypothetical protein